MSMNGIDVSNWQNGIDLSAVPADFVICKATQGTTYTSPDCVRQYEQAKAAGRCLGVYHYIGGSGAVAEADFFIDSVANWVGEAILVLDWESNQNDAWGDEGYLDTMVKRVIERTGVPPIIYASKSVFPWTVANNNNCGAWVAQYANNDTTGYQDSPWNEGAYSCAIRQYSSSGRLSGYSGNLDLNKAYMNPEQWKLYANPNGNASAGSGGSGGSSASPSGSTLDLAVAVMRGDYGDGDARKNALGSRYEEVQSFINHIFSASAEDLANEVWNGTYGDGDTRKTVLGSRYEEVQAIVNGGTSVDIDALARAVIRGEYGNGQERKNKLGDLYDEVQARVNELL